MLEFSFCWTGRREGQSEKETEESLGSKRVLGTGWVGRFLARRQQSCAVEARLRQWKGQKCLSVAAEGPSHLPRASGSAVLPREAAPCVGWVLLFLSFFRVWEQAQNPLHNKCREERGGWWRVMKSDEGWWRVIKGACGKDLCMPLHLKMWCNDSQTEGSWTQ